MKKEKEDWRLQAYTTVAKDWKSPFTGITHKKGEPFYVSAIVKNNNLLMAFPIPNIASIFLNLSYKTWINADKYIEEINIYWTNGISSYIPKSHEDLFNFIEKRMESIVFAYTALETFANESVPDDYVFEIERGDRKCIERYNKDQIERYINLELKLSKILPEIFNVTSPSGGTIWNKYINIKNLRDRIIHMKSRDCISSGPEDETIWKELFTNNIPNPALEVKNIIGYYLSNASKKPLWFDHFPYQ